MDVGGLCYHSCGGLQPAGGSAQEMVSGANPQPAACSALPSGPACLGAQALQQPALFLQDVRAPERASDSEQFPCQPLSTLLAQREASSDSHLPAPLLHADGETHVDPTSQQPWGRNPHPQLMVTLTLDRAN